MDELPSSGQYSLKNIPIPPESSQEFDKKFVSQLEHFLRRVRWRAIYYLKHLEEKSNIISEKSSDEEDIEFEEAFENYGFKSGLKPTTVPDLIEFENACWNLYNNLEYRQISNKFQRKIISDLNKAKKAKKIIIPADKTSNQYMCSVPTYEKILTENITKEYKASNITALVETDKKSAEYAQSLKLEKRMQKYTTSPAFITLKDHKPNFLTKLPARLINPAKNELARVTQVILKKVVSEIRHITSLNQWCNTQTVLKWFKKLKNPNNLKFFKFDIVNFYPSISEKLMKNAIEYARSINGIVITKSEEEMIYQCRETYLFYKGKPWVKKEDGKEKFDVAMGSFDGAEICELAGLFLLHKLTSGKNPIFMKEFIGLYRDDGLAVFRGSARNAEMKIKPLVKNVFKEEDLEITIEAPTQTTDFLDVELDLARHEHRPYRKPNDTIMYINVHSNHPKNIIKQIKPSCEMRLSALSSSEEVFNNKKGPYEKALKDSGHDHNLKFIPQNSQPTKRKQKRKVIYCNLPFSKHVKTKVGKEFLKLVKDCFKNDHPLRKIFNRSTIKFSPCTLTNMKQQYSKINAKILSINEGQTAKSIPILKCNCTRKPYKNNCPLQGQCQQKSVVYQATIESNNETKIYYGSTKNEFKTRFLQHMSSFNTTLKKSSTTLARYVKKLKNQNFDFKISWSIKAKAHTFSSGSKKCDLCVTEKLTILKADPQTLLNKRDELLAKCPHKRSYYLSSMEV